MLDVSIHLMILVASDMSLWVIYGFIRSDPVIIGANITGFCPEYYFVSYAAKVFNETSKEVANSGLFHSESAESRQKK
jgi:hypothetical protein